MRPQITDVAALAAEAEHRFGAFVRERVNREADTRDRNGEPLPRRLLHEAGVLGLFGFSLPREIGGEGRDKFAWGIVIEAIARCSQDPCLTSLVDVNAGVAELLLATGGADLAGRYGARIAQGQFLCSVAAYESRDPFDYLTTAHEIAGGWVLDGAKPFVGGALIADAFVVYARDHESGDILAFLVERGDQGVSVDPLSTMGLRSMGFGSLRLDQVHVPSARLLVAADGLSSMNAYLRNRRVMTAAAVVGHMRGLFEAAVPVLAERQRSGRSVLEFPNVQRTIGEIFVGLEASQAVVHRALAALSDPRDQFFDPVATAAKAFVSERAIQMALAVMNLMGGEAYMAQHPWERSMRDVLALIGGQGAQELLLIQLGQQLTLQMVEPFSR